MAGAAEWAREKYVLRGYAVLAQATLQGLCIRRCHDVRQADSQAPRTATAQVSCPLRFVVRQGKQHMGAAYTLLLQTAAEEMGGNGRATQEMEGRKDYARREGFTETPSGDDVIQLSAALDPSKGNFH